jgi:precorrin-2/cobalt-factor-2 C20-methyltransferase
MAFSVIGVGPGDSELLTIKAVRLIKEADVIVVPVKKEGAKASTALSIAKPYIEDMDKVSYLYFPMALGFEKDEKTRQLFKEYGKHINELLAKGKAVVFLTLGDPTIYSTYSYMDQYIEEVGYVSGIPSFISGAALAKQSLCLGDESFCVLNMSDDEASIRQKFALHECIIVMKVSMNQALLKALILEGKRSASILSNIGFEDESMTEDINVLDDKLPYFSLAIIR